MAKQLSPFEKLPRDLQPEMIKRIIEAYSLADQYKRLNGKELPRPMLERNPLNTANPSIDTIARDLESWLKSNNFPFMAKELMPDCMEIKRKLSNAEPHSQRLNLAIATIVNQLDRLDSLSGLCAEQSTLTDEINALEQLPETQNRLDKLNGLRAKKLMIDDEIMLQEAVVLATENRNILLQQGGNNEP
ncbi:MAG: hypothetical protein WCK96_14985 [Methylococcales bacterium]